MSQFITKLREEKDEEGQTGRDGIDWPSPVGTWKQGEDISRLETFANNLDVAQAAADTDLLNSIPTPWARLLLFESALYKEKHPSHRDVEDQWRGLLGLIALADALRLNLGVEGVSLGEFAGNGSAIAKSFVDLRPHHLTERGDEEQDKWDTFQMISVDKVVLGATSPRTFVFTGVAHQCPPSVPFRTASGRLSDPVAYYKKFNDTLYLGLLARWLNGLVTSLSAANLGQWLGSIPSAKGAGQATRMDLLLARLQAWQQELNGVAPANIAGGQASHFTVYPYTLLTSLPRIDAGGKSDLYLKEHTDTVVCFRPESGSRLLNAFGQELVNESLRIYDGRWIRANQPIPLPLNYLPEYITKRIEDPAAFFEDTLIQVVLPENPLAVHVLALGEQPPAQNRYLYPFKREILNYFSPDEIKRITTLAPNPQSSSIRVELNIPLENDRTVRVTRDYPLDTGVIADTETVTAELAAWPDFTSPAWSRYFYCKIKSAGTGFKLLDFEPVVGGDSRSRDNVTWYASREPVPAFVGAVGGKSGLLLLNMKSVEQPTSFWKVSVDFGSTHTRAFSLRMERRGADKNAHTYATAKDATIQPVPFSARALSVTGGSDPLAFRPFFFAIADETDGREELKTLLMMPETAPGIVDAWLPREGFVYTHWILDGDYDPNRLRYNLKWNSDRSDPDLRAYLRCLLVMIQAEALRQGARVVSVAHTYPSVFTDALVAKHQNEWSDLGNYLNLGVPDPGLQVTVENAQINETVAVCRHLGSEQEAKTANNTISLDVGGSTTDMAVWAQNELRAQESVKMAAGVINRYLQSPDAQGFLKWLETVLQGAPYNLRRVSLAKFATKPAGYALMFNNVLSWLEQSRQLPTLIRQVNAAPEARQFMSHVIYLFAGLLYYAGLLSRKAGLPKFQHFYSIYFCGKGGTLAEWINGYRTLAQDIFEAGLVGPAELEVQGAPVGEQPEARQEKKKPTVETTVSAYPKAEVGRGLLVENWLEGRQQGERLGLSDPIKESATVGETGYEGLAWEDDLTIDALSRLPDNTVPEMGELKELNTFLKAFIEGRATKAAAVELNLHNLDAERFRVNLLQRLFGQGKGSIVSDIRKNDPDALLESLFITEIKVMLETATRNVEMYP